MPNRINLKNKTTFLIISVLLIFAFIFFIGRMYDSSGYVLGGEYTVEEGGECTEAGDCEVVGCRTASCVSNECVYSDMPDGTSCDDGLICTEGDACQSGSCVGQAADVDDAIACTIDSCDEINGVTHTPDNSLCDEGEFCDPDSGCVSLICNNDGVKDENEECDDTDFGDYDGTCHDYDAQYGSGDLVCSDNCTMDTSSCVSGVCGDGVINTEEGCDDGNTDDGDGCSSACQIESGYNCSGEPSVCSSTPTPTPTPTPGGTSGGRIQPPPDDGMTIEELKAMIAELLAKIAKLKAQLAQLRGIVGVPADYRFEKNLKFGQNLEDVRYLQIFLNSDHDTQIVRSGFGSPGNETIHFGYLTRAAVIRFQEKYAQDILTSWRLTRGTGFIGRTTRAKINEVLGR